MTKYVERMNMLLAAKRRNYAALSNEYPDHPEDLELAWESTRVYWDELLDEIAEEAFRNGRPVKYDLETRSYKKR